MYNVIAHVSSSGKNHFKEFLAALPDNVRIKVIGHINYLQSVGPLAKRPRAALLRDKIYELRITFGHLEPRIWRKIL
ncbi:MAG: hypothetical protein A2293_16020 [Elusimicrobia bacterium RIFOXYB2_FULL_49_7]|nr:MAG: hypothetical protein A2293_16020 [Elusimicrobia bacterium RIFOXYB2_FULL_49_7]